MRIGTKGFAAALLILTASVVQAAELELRTWDVDGVRREALVWMPETAGPKPLPVVFAFHGHGGNMRNAARSFRMHEFWPEAIVVYMQGLPTPGQLTDPQGKRNGWNADPDDPQNRDLTFFDAVYDSLRGRTDTNRVYCTGHSNGGSFTYCLWAARGARFAAVAPSGAAAAKSLRRLTPKPALHVAGRSDPLVKYEWQERTMQAVRRVNGCAEKGEPWASSGSLTGTLYPSSSGTPLVTLISPGGHNYPAEASELIVRFFKEHIRR